MAKSKTKVTRKWIHPESNAFASVRTEKYSAEFELSDGHKTITFLCWEDSDFNSQKKMAASIIEMLELYISEIDRAFKVNDPPASGDENWNKKSKFDADKWKVENL